jgi:hypothetical protein
VASGSVGGLCAAHRAARRRREVDMHERATGAMAARGAGIVVQDDLLRLLRACGAPELPATSCRGDGAESPMPQRFTSWDAIFRTLRAAFPDERYHPGSALTGFEGAAGGNRTSSGARRPDLGVPSAWAIQAGLGPLKGHGYTVGLRLA